MTERSKKVLDLLQTAARIAAIFAAIVAVFSFAMDRGESDETIVAAAQDKVIEQPKQPKRALSALAAPAGAASLLRR